MDNDCRRVQNTLFFAPNTNDLHYNNTHSTLLDARLHALNILNCGCANEEISEICFTTAILHLLQTCDLYPEVSK